MDIPALCIFATAPQAGRVMEPLAATLGAEAALGVHARLLAVTAEAATAWPGRVEVHAEGDDLALDASPLGSFPRWPQRLGSRGDRLKACLGGALGRNHPAAAMVIGTGCPGLTITHLLEMAGQLASHGAAFGPTGDGDVWCVALRDPFLLPAICRADLPWEGPDLLEAMRARLFRLRTISALGPALPRITTAQDLLRARSGGFGGYA